MFARPLIYLRLALAAVLPSASAALAQDMRAQVYSADSVWNWGSHMEDLPGLCGVSSSFDLRPDDSIADAGCVEAAMRQLGASESAVRFFEATGQFLGSFEARGAIDFGHASSPWLNMGRGEAVLLNGTPSAILMSRMLNGRDESWKSQVGYADLLQQSPNAFPWVEYGGPLDERAADGGGVIIISAFDMRVCRACANLATLRAEATFDPQGFIRGVNVLPPGPPRA